ncbi:hypothetical protein FRC10_012113 [Ceratobasidium sp. 414]|nr:hypothetical protein FRC10_012113 [Ceratobasidium sp. 414]
MAAAAAIRDEACSPPPAIAAPAENWDDDFLFHEDSPAKPPPSRPRSSTTRQIPPEKRWSSHSVSDAAGAWDEELEREEAERQSSAGSSSLGPAAGAAVAPRTDLSRWAEPDEEDEEDFGFAVDTGRHAVGEDTVSPLPVFSNPGAGTSTQPSPNKRARPTSPSRSSISTSASARSSPVMHTRQVPGSPALSLFSMSTSTAQQYTPSLASSTAHLRTTRSHDTGTVGPFVPAQPRVPRRRLRKKSRPARPGDIAEHDDSGGGAVGGGAYVMREPSPPDGGGLGLAMTTEEEASWSESSNQPQPQERTPSPPPAPVAGPSSPPTRTPLLTRIGSLKTKLGRRPKASGTPPSSFTPTSPTVPVPSTPARTRAPRSSTTPKQQPFSPETPNASVRSPRARAPSWFRSASGTGPAPSGSSPEEHIDTAHGLVRRKSKEPFWRGVGSFSSGRSPVLPPSTDPSEHDPKSDHEQTVKKPPRKSLSTTARPPLPLPMPPQEAGSPTPAGGKLVKARRPMSMTGPAGGGAIKVGVAKVPASLGRGAGAGWASALGNGVDEGPDGKEKGGVMSSLRRLSHSRKKSTGPGEDPGRPRIPSATSTAPGSSVTTGSRVPSSSTIPSLHEWDGGRRPSGSVPKSASAIVLSSSAASPREFDPSVSAFTLPIGMGEESEERELTRQSLTVELRSSTSRPSSPLAARPVTPHAPRPSSPLATRRPSTPLHRPGTPLACVPMTLREEQSPPPVPAIPNEDVIIVREPVTPGRSQHLLGSRPIVFEDGVEFAIFTPEKDKADEVDEKEKEDEEKEDAVSIPPVSAGRQSLSSGRNSGSMGSRSRIHRKSASVAHTKSASEPAWLTSDLLPPIELQPPSPPHTLSGRTGEEHQSLLQLTTPPKSLSNSLSGFTTPSSTPSKLTARLHHGNSPIGQSSSLSRASTQPGGPLEGNSVLRRNSLSDLKIPARISRAQSGLKSNLGMVREFAGSVEQIRRLQTMYRNLLADLKYAIENGEPLSPVLFPPAPRASATSATLVRVPSRDIGRVADRLNLIDEKYGLWWECADVIVELGGGGSGSKDTSTTVTTGDKAPVTASPDKDAKANGRERAITLAGNQATPTVEPATKKEQWDKERGELSPRQLQILREMLSTPNPSLLHVPLPATNINTAAYLNALHPGGTASAVTLPSSSASSSHMHGQDPRAVLNSQSVVKLPETAKATTGAGKIRRASRAGINGIKDLLKHLNLKKPLATGSSAEGSRPPTRMAMGAESQVDVTSPTAAAGSRSQIHLGAKSELNLVHQSQLNLARQSQLNLARQSQTHLPQSRPYPSRSHGPAATPIPVPAPHKSPRRPSLASIFRLNGAGRSKSKGRAVSASNLGSQTTTSSTTEDDMDESDWDRMDSASDLDLRIKAHGEEKDATLRGRKSGSLGGINRPPVPALPAQFAASKSQISLSRGSPDEAAFGTGTDLASGSAGPVRSDRFKQKTPSGLAQVTTSVSGIQPGLRSAPLQSPVGSGYPSAEGVEGRLALTPETIKPLLEYAREVTARLDQCVAELRELGMNDGEKLSV